MRGVNAGGHTFEVETLLENLSASGLYLRSAEQVEEGERVFLLIQFSPDSPPQSRSSRLAVRGVVRRAERHADGACGLAIQIQQHRFL
jgi:hypothetical protein